MGFRVVAGAGGRAAACLSVPTGQYIAIAAICAHR